jgi:hypothetical protein
LGAACRLRLVGVGDISLLEVAQTGAVYGKYQFWLMFVFALLKGVAIMTARKKSSGREKKVEAMQKFLSYLDSLPEDGRPLYGVLGQNSGLWHTLGGGTQHISVIIFRDRVAFMTHGLLGVRQTGRWEQALVDLSEIRVRPGPLFSSVEFRFRDNSKKKIVNVERKHAEPLAQFMNKGLQAFDRSLLDVDALYGFYSACDKGLPLPVDVFKEEMAPDLAAQTVQPAVNQQPATAPAEQFAEQAIVGQEEVTQQAVACSSCGASNSAAAKFCTRCGTAMKG